MGLDIHLLTVVEGEQISHNYVEFAKELGVYYPIWRGNMYGIYAAEDLIPFLDLAMRLLDDKEVVNEAAKRLRDKEYDSVDEFKRFVFNLRRYCAMYPGATLEFSR